MTTIGELEKTLRMRGLELGVTFDSFGWEAKLRPTRSAMVVASGRDASMERAILKALASLEQK